MVVELICASSRLVSSGNLSSPSRSRTSTDLHDLGEEGRQMLGTDPATDLPHLDQGCLHLVSVILGRPRLSHLLGFLPFLSARVAAMQW